MTIAVDLGRKATKQTNKILVGNKDNYKGLKVSEFRPDPIPIKE